MIGEKINENSPWQDITEGNKIFQGATSREFCTGEWRTSTPVWDREKCKQCLLCTPVCPDSSIPVKDKLRGDLIMITVRAAVSAPEYVPLVQLL